MKTTIAALMMCLSLSGCAELSLLSNAENYQGHETLHLDKAPTNALDGLAEVGKSLGYSVSSMDKEGQSVGLTSQTSSLAAGLIGHYGMTTLTIKVLPDGATLDVGILLTGNFGSGGQAEAEKVFGDFKRRVEARFGS